MTTNWRATNWRELRDTLSREGAFGTINTISPRDSGKGIGEASDSNPLVNSANSAKRSEKATNSSGDPTVNSVKSVESLGDLEVAASWEWIEERASIMEFEGGLDRETANARAFEFWFRRFVGEIKMTRAVES
jgi:hypothetical protein